MVIVRMAIAAASTASIFCCFSRFIHGYPGCRRILDRHGRTKSALFGMNSKGMHTLTTLKTNLNSVEPDVKLLIFGLDAPELSA